MIIATLAPLQTVVFALAAVVAPAVVLARDPLKMAVINGFYTWVLVVLFVVLGAPDVALSMLVAGTVGYPLVLLITISRSRKKTQ